MKLKEQLDPWAGMGIGVSQPTLAFPRCWQLYFLLSSNFQTREQLEMPYFLGQKALNL